MRLLYLVPTALVLTACAGDTRTTLPTDPLPLTTNQATTNAVVGSATIELGAAASDVRDRVLPSLNPPAIAELGPALSLFDGAASRDARNDDISASPLPRLAKTLRRLRAERRVDVATLDAIALEFGISLDTLGDIDGDDDLALDREPAA